VGSVVEAEEITHAVRRTELGCTRNLTLLPGQRFRTRDLRRESHNLSQMSYMRNNWTGPYMRNRRLFRSTKKLMVAD
jgi:hypothetical protein